MSNGYEHHFGPRPQTDLEAANSAEPDTDRKPLWNDPGYDAYLFAVDAGYRIDWYLEHGDREAALDEEEAQREQERGNIETDEDARNFIANYGYDDEDDED